MSGETEAGAGGVRTGSATGTASGSASGSATRAASGKGAVPGRGAASAEAPLRADALRNRRKILAAAKETFAARGPHIPMEDVARRAGVGVATLYRRFPDRESLIRAVAQDTFARVLEESRAAVAEEPGAWQALVRMLRSSRELQLSVQLAVESSLARGVIKNDPGTGRFRDELLDVLDQVVRAAQDEGTLRPDVEGGDVAALLSLLLRRRVVPAEDADGQEGRDAGGRAGEDGAGPGGGSGGGSGGGPGGDPGGGEDCGPSGDAADVVSERALGLMLDGLRARPGNTPLPGEPLSVGDFEARTARDSDDLERRTSAERRAAKERSGRPGPLTG